MVISFRGGSQRRASPGIPLRPTPRSIPGQDTWLSHLLISGTYTTSVDSNIEVFLEAKKYVKNPLLEYETGSCYLALKKYAEAREEFRTLRDASSGEVGSDFELSVVDAAIEICDEHLV
jgi:hypothetical protein